MCSRRSSATILARSSPSPSSPPTSCWRSIIVQPAGMLADRLGETAGLPPREATGRISEHRAEVSPEPTLSRLGSAGHLRPERLWLYQRAMVGLDAGQYVSPIRWRGDPAFPAHLPLRSRCLQESQDRQGSARPELEAAR